MMESGIAHGGGSGVVLAIDHGEARVGLALSDIDRRYALAHGTIPARPRGEAMHTILRLLHEERVSTVVIGLPLRLDGSEGEQGAIVRDFARELGAQTSVPIVCVDERFTSKDGEVSARAKGTSDRDAEAARLILELWLERERHTRKE